MAEGLVLRVEPPSIDPSSLAFRNLMSVELRECKILLLAKHFLTNWPALELQSPPSLELQSPPSLELQSSPFLKLPSPSLELPGSSFWSLTSLKLRELPRSLTSLELLRSLMLLSSLKRLELPRSLASLELLSSLTSLRSLKLLELLRSVKHLRSLALLEPPSLSSLNEDWVNNDGVSPDREGEDNHVSSENDEGRLDDDSGSNGVRLIFLLDGEESLTGDTPRTITGIADGTIESVVEFAIEQWLRGQEEVNLDRLDRMFGNFDLEDVLTTDPSYSSTLKRKMNRLKIELLRTLEMNPELSSEELKEYYHAICWNLMKRLLFFCRLNERLLLKATAPDQPDLPKELLSKELESKKARVFNGEWIDKIEPRFRPSRRYDYESFGELLRFTRNWWNHLLETSKASKALKEFLGSGSAERFYNYFDERFPNLLMVSYGAASRVCREEEWFEEFRGSDAL